MNKRSILILLILFNGLFLKAQQLGSSPEYVKELTSLWKGERSADGRPKVSDLLLERLQYNTLEQIWGYLGGKGYRNQLEKNWVILKTGKTMVGRVVCTVYAFKA
jgi:hypothetical protein